MTKSEHQRFFLNANSPVPFCHKYFCQRNDGDQRGGRQCGAVEPWPRCRWLWTQPCHAGGQGFELTVSSRKLWPLTSCHLVFTLGLLTSRVESLDCKPGSLERQPVCVKLLWVSRFACFTVWVNPFQANGMAHDNNNQEAKRLKMEQSQPSKIKPSKVIHIRWGDGWN